MKIYYITSEIESTISGKTRWNNLTKKQILKKSWISLNQSINETDFIYIIYDKVSKNTLNWMSETAQGIIKFIPVKKLTLNKYNFLLTALTELEKNLKNSERTDLHILIEDDYLFVYDALDVIRENMKYWHGFGVPYDSPNRYKEGVPCQVFVGLDRHWRTVNRCEGWTVFAATQTWQSSISKIKEAAKNNDWSIFNNGIEESPIISPMPGVACHLKEDHMTPLINWTDIWQAIEIYEETT